MEDLGGCALSRDSVTPVSGSVSLAVGERKHVDREVDVEELFGIARSLAEAVVERPAPRTADFVDELQT